MARPCNMMQCIVWSNCNLTVFFLLWFCTLGPQKETFKEGKITPGSRTSRVAADWTGQGAVSYCSHFGRVAWLSPIQNIYLAYFSNLKRTLGHILSLCFSTRMYFNEEFSTSWPVIKKFLWLLEASYHLCLLILNNQKYS